MYCYKVINTNKLCVIAIYSHLAIAIYLVVNQNSLKHDYPCTCHGQAAPFLSVCPLCLHHTSTSSTTAIYKLQLLHLRHEFRNLYTTLPVTIINHSRSHSHPHYRSKQSSLVCSQPFPVDGPSEHNCGHTQVN